MSKAQRDLSDALVDRMETLQEQLERKYRRYVRTYRHPDGLSACQFEQWVDGEPKAVEMEALKAAYFALPINRPKRG